MNIEQQALKLVNEVKAGITTQAARIAELEAENFMLAAGVCINPGQHALVGDEHGNSICTAYEALQTAEREHSEALARIAELEARVERMREALRACRRAISNGKDEPRRNVREIVDEALAQETNDG